MRRRKFKPFKYPEFRRLWESERLSEEEKNRLFYCSLFDYSSLEEDEDINLSVRLFGERKKELGRLIRKADTSFFNKYIQKDKNGFFKFIGTDILCRFIIFYELKKRKIKLKFLKKKQIFPDMLTLQGDHIEIKRLISAKNLGDYLESIKSKDLKEINKIVLVLILPSLLDNGSAKRIKDLIKGYYSYERYLCLETKKQCNVIPHYETGDNLSELIEQIVKKLI